MKGTSLFTEVVNSLRTIKLQMDKSILNLGGSIGDFSKVEEMLKQERVDFEVSFLSVYDFDMNLVAHYAHSLIYTCLLLYL